jgi:type 2 lantibiotic biosynthesis protein LanM
MQHEKQLRQIAVAASSLKERLNTQVYQPSALDTGELATEAMLAEWRRIVADGVSQTFEARLRRLQLDPSSAHLALADVTLLPDAPLPEWAGVFADIMNAPPTLSGATQDPRPFVEALLPFLGWARRTFAEQVGIAGKLLNRAAIEQLHDQLVDRLVWLSSRVFALKLNMARVRGQLQGANARKRYQYFVSEVISKRENLWKIFLDYPVLARLLTTVTQNWVGAQVEMLTRLQEDIEEISTVFGSGHNVGQVCSIQTGLSDFHRASRAVSLVKFDSGLQLVYKPRDVLVDDAFQRLLCWLNEQNGLVDLKALTILPCEHYGWEEYVTHQPCRSIVEVADFYRRQGMLLCLTSLLGGSDFHCENVIAHGSYPILVDLETILPHLLHREFLTSRDAELRIAELFVSSVWRTGLLPGLTFLDPNHLGIDFSGFGARPDQPSLYLQQHWVDAGTDEMAIKFQDAPVSMAANHLPQLSGRYQLPWAYTSHLLEGFQHTYDLMLTHRSALLAAGSPLMALSSGPVRYVPRPTQIYHEVLLKSLEPVRLTDGVRRDMLLELLWRGRTTDNIASQLVEHEIQDLQQADIPMFTSEPHHTDLYASDHTRLDDVLLMPSAALSLQGLSRATVADRVHQTEVVRSSLLVAAEGYRDTSQSPVDSISLPNQAAAAPDYLQAATDIADELDRMAVHNRRSCNWIGVQYHVDSQQFSVQPVGIDLYNGTCGIALFFGSLYAMHHQTRFRELAYKALQPTTNLVRAPQQTRAAIGSGHLPLGGFTGVGSVIYTLTKLATLLEDGNLLAYALSLASIIDTTLITRDRDIDLLSGSAGCAISLTRLYEASHEPVALEKAILCSEHLLQMRHDAQGGVLSTRQSPFRLYGMAHGAAGIAYALLATGKATDEERFSQTGLKMFYDMEQAMASDLHTTISNRATWCHGATGIGFATLASRNLRSDRHCALLAIERTVAAVRASIISDRDHLCCGLLGEVDFLVEAGVDLGQPALLDEARRWATAVMQRQRRTTHWALSPHPNIRLPVPGLMQGLAGIGLAMLRLADPLQVRSVLSLR